MNGDLQTIYDKISEISHKLVIIETKQEERHSENKQDIAVLFKMQTKDEDRFATLECGEHLEKMNNIAGKVNWLYGIVGACAGGTILIFVRHLVTG